ncbi:hypothetical protein HDU93_001008, partial [Gonapodya sp. JEL0774]
ALILPSSHPFTDHVATLNLSPTSSTAKPSSGPLRNRKPSQQPPLHHSESSNPSPVSQPTTILTLSSLLNRFPTLPIILDIHSSNADFLSSIVAAVRKDRFARAKPLVVPPTPGTTNSANPTETPKALSTIAWGSTTHPTVSATLTRLNTAAQLSEFAQLTSPTTPHTSGSSRRKTAAARKDPLATVRSQERFARVPTLTPFTALASYLGAYWLWYLPFIRTPDSIVLVPSSFPSTPTTPRTLRGFTPSDLAPLFPRLAARAIAVLVYSPVPGHLERVDVSVPKAADGTRSAAAFPGLEESRNAGSNGVCVARWERAQEYVKVVVATNAGESTDSVVGS